MINLKKIVCRSILTALAVLFTLAVPAAAQSLYDFYDLGIDVATQDIQADSTNTVHLIWTYKGVLYYGQIVNNALTGKVQIATGVSVRYWRPYLSVRPDGKTLHTVWCQGGGVGNKLMHSWRDSTGKWRSQTVYAATASKQISMPSCAVDDAGQVHVLFGVFNNVKTNMWFTLFYKKRAVNGTWGTLVAFAPKYPEHTFPMMFTDSTGRVHATWCIVGRLGEDRNEAYYCTVASGGTLNYASKVKIPKGPGVTLNGFGEIYVDRNGVVHRSIAGWSGSLQKLCIDHTKMLRGGSFSVPTRPSYDFLDLGACDPVPAMVAAEDGSAIVAWGHVKKDGSNEVMASLFDPITNSWNLTIVDPAAGIPAREGAYRVAMTRTDTNLYGVWRASSGRLNLFAIPMAVQNMLPGIIRVPGN